MATVSGIQQSNDVQVTMSSKAGVTLATAGTYNAQNITVTPGFNVMDGLSTYATTATLVTTGTGTVAETAITVPQGHTLQVDDFIFDTNGTVGQVTAVGSTVSYSFYTSLLGPKGATGDSGTPGTNGTDGEDGLSMYPVSTALVTSGTGSVPLSNITLPEFRSIQIGDLLLGTNGVVGRATSTGSTVFYTAFTSIQGQNGTNGTDGDPGPAGRPALTCAGLNIDTQGSAIPVGQSFTTGMATLNQTPIVGDKLITIINTATETYPDGKSYLCGCNVTGVSGNQGTTGSTFTFSVASSVQATGNQGSQGPAGEGVPTGGTAGQVLAKASGTNYDTEWVDQTGGSDTIIDLGSFFGDNPGGTLFTATGTITQQLFNQLSANSKVKLAVYNGELQYNISGTLSEMAEEGFSTGYGFVMNSIYGETKNTLSVYIYGTSSSYSVTVRYKNEDSNFIQSNTASQSNFSTVSNIVTTTESSPNVSALPEGTLVIQIPS